MNTSQATLLTLFYIAVSSLCIALPLKEPKKLTDGAAKRSQMPMPSEDEMELDNLKQGKFGDENDIFPLKPVSQGDSTKNNLETAETKVQVPAIEPAVALNKAAMTGGVKESSLDMTPKAVAEYLLITADFQGFDSAVADLLSSNVITQEEAQTYKDAVGAEYENLLRKLVDAEEAYLEEYLTLAAARRGMGPRSRRGGAQAVAPKSQVPAQGLDNKASDVNLALRRMQLRSLLEREATLDELLQVLVRDYLDTDMMTNPIGMNGPALPVAVPTKAAANSVNSMKNAMKPGRVMSPGSTLAPVTNRPQQAAA